MSTIIYIQPISGLQICELDLCHEVLIAMKGISPPDEFTQNFKKFEMVKTQICQLQGFLLWHQPVWNVLSLLKMQQITIQFKKEL